MSEQSNTRPCRWDGCGEAATRRTGHLEHVGVGQGGTQGAATHNQTITPDVCDHHFEELRSHAGVTETPLDESSVITPAP